jgi:hypothetical protein
MYQRLGSNHHQNKSGSWSIATDGNYTDYSHGEKYSKININSPNLKSAAVNSCIANEKIRTLSLNQQNGAKNKWGWGKTDLKVNRNIPSEPVITTSGGYVKMQVDTTRGRNNTFTSCNRYGWDNRNLGLVGGNIIESFSVPNSQYNVLSTKNLKNSTPKNVKKLSENCHCDMGW